MDARDNRNEVNERKGVYGWFGVTTPIFDPDHRFVASPWMTPILLGSIRLVFAVYMTASIIAEPILLKQSRRTRREAKRFPAYFTNITFMAMAAYFWVSGIHALVYGLKGVSPLRKLPRFLQLLHTLFYSTITTFPFVVTAVYWSLLDTPPHKKSFATPMRSWNNITFHCLNSVFAFFELSCSAVGPQRWTHVLIIITILLLYVSMAYVIYATTHYYVYGFLDHTVVGNLTAAYIFGIGGMGVVVFFVVQGLAWCKVRCRKKVIKSAYDYGDALYPQAGFTVPEDEEGKAYVHEMREL